MDTLDKTIFKYCNYSLEQLMEYSKYQEICNMFLSLAQDEETKEKLESILYEGGYKDFSISSKICNKDNPSIEMSRRISTAYIILRNPETFDMMVQHKVSLFHGTNGNALPGILTYGLNSLVESEKNNIEVNTGEEWSREYSRRNFVSLADALHISEFYAGISAKKGDEKLNFEVILGTSVPDVYDKSCIVSSDVLEVGVKNNIPLDNIRMIFVPSDKLAFVRKIVGDKSPVMPLDDMNDKFFYFDDFYGFEILDDKYQQFKKKIKQDRKTFGKKEVKDLLLTRTLRKMKESLKAVTTLFGREEEISYDARVK